MGRQGRPRFALLSPRRRADRPGPGDGLRGLERHLRHAPRRPRRDAGRAHCRQAWCARDIAAPALSRRARSRACHSPTARWPKATSSSRRTASTRSFGTMSRRRRGRSSHGSVAYRGVLPHERIPHWPTDCWQMWLGKGKHFLSFPVRPGELINYVGFVPADAGDEGIMVGARRSRRAAPRVRGLGPAYREPC